MAHAINFDDYTAGHIAEFECAVVESTLNREQITL